MSVVDVGMRVVHLLFAAAWAGGALFMAGIVLPAVSDERMAREDAQVLGDRYLTVSRLSALVMILSGGHLAGNVYGAERLFGTTDGYMVLAMAGLWIVLAGLVEVGQARLDRRDAPLPRHLFRAAAVVGAVLLTIGALLA